MERSVNMIKRRKSGEKGEGERERGERWLGERMCVMVLGGKGECREGWVPLSTPPLSAPPLSATLHTAVLPQYWTVLRGTQHKGAGSDLVPRGPSTHCPLPHTTGIHQLRLP